MENPLALAVYNDGSSYKARCEKFLSMKESQYRGYLQALAAKQAKHEHTHFGVRHKPAAIAQAADELYEAMKMHMAEMRESSNA